MKKALLLRALDVLHLDFIEYVDELKKNVNETVGSSFKQSPIDCSFGHM